MPLIPYADPNALPEETQASLARLPPLNIFRMWANAATCFVPGIRYGGAILTKQKLAPALRELIVLAVGRIDAATYEWVQHVPIARGVGVREDQIAALEADRFDDDAFNPEERILLRLTREIVRDVRASEWVVNEAKNYFSAQEITEIILTVGFYMTIARLTETTRVDIDAPPGVAIPAFARV
jgi:alkylhydroperoxidase family enzyme